MYAYVAILSGPVEGRTALGGGIVLGGVCGDNREVLVECLARMECRTNARETLEVKGWTCQGFECDLDKKYYVEEILFVPLTLVIGQHLETFFGVAILAMTRSGPCTRCAEPNDESSSESTF